MNSQQQFKAPAQPCTCSTKAPRMLTVTEVIALLAAFPEEPDDSKTTLAELWEKRNRQDRKRLRNRRLLVAVYLFLFTAIGVLLAWPSP